MRKGIINAVPVVDAGPDQTINKGGIASFSGSITDPDDNTHTIVWDFGDGSIATGILTPTHTYVDSGTYTVTFTAADNGEGKASDTLTVIVEDSTLIELDRFTAVPQKDSIIITWNTLSEIDNAGFTLWRSEVENGEYVKINPLLIEAMGGATLRAEYSFIDDTAMSGITYYYKLEDIDLRGAGTFHDPVSAMIPASPAVQQVQDYPLLPFWFERCKWYPDSL